MALLPWRSLLGSALLIFDQAIGGGSTPGFLSTHPATSERINSLQQQINPQVINSGDGLDSRAYRQQIIFL